MTANEKVEAVKAKCREVGVVTGLGLELPEYPEAWHCLRKLVLVNRANEWLAHDSGCGCESCRWAAELLETQA